MTLDQVFTAIAAISQAVEACCVCLSLLFAVLVAIYGWRELREMQKSRKLDVVDKLAGWIHNPVASNDRYFVLNELPADPSQASPEQRDRAHKVWANLQLVAYYVNEELIPERIVMRGNSELFVRCWQKLKPYIETERQLRGEHPGRPYYARDFETFAKKCAEYYRREYPEHSLPSI